jgi:hypothetical protein
MTGNEEMQAQAVLYGKLARVMGKVRNLEKTGFNEHFKYKFVTDGAVSNAISAALAAENVAFIPSILESKQDDKKITKTRFLFTFCCGDTGAIFQATWEGEGMDNQDKGVSKSATSAVKYFLLKTFLIDTGERADDPDNDAALDKRGGKSNAQPKNTPKPAQQKPTEPDAPTFDATTGAEFVKWIAKELVISEVSVLAALSKGMGKTIDNVTEWAYGIPEAIGAVIALTAGFDETRINAWVDNVKNTGAGFKNSHNKAFRSDQLDTFRDMALKLAK